MEKDYVVTYKVDGRLAIPVKAMSIEEALKKAVDGYYAANIGDLECVDAEAVTVEDDDDIVWEK